MIFPSFFKVFLILPFFRFLWLGWQKQGKVFLKKEIKKEVEEKKKLKLEAAAATKQAEQEEKLLVLQKKNTEKLKIQVADWKAKLQEDLKKLNQEHEGFAKEYDKKMLLRVQNFCAQSRKRAHLLALQKNRFKIRDGLDKEVVENFFDKLTKKLNKSGERR